MRGWGLGYIGDPTTTHKTEEITFIDFRRQRFLSLERDLNLAA